MDYAGRLAFFKRRGGDLIVGTSHPTSPPAGPAAGPAQPVSPKFSAGSEPERPNATQVPTEHKVLSPAGWSD